MKNRLPRKLKKKIKKIPFGNYCYTDNNYNTQYCYFYNFSKKSYNTCNFLKYYDYEPSLDDGCKLCSHNKK